MGHGPYLNTGHPAVQDSQSCSPSYRGEQEADGGGWGASAGSLGWAPTWLPWLSSSGGLGLLPRVPLQAAFRGLLLRARPGEHGLWQRLGLPCWVSQSLKGGEKGRLTPGSPGGNKASEPRTRPHREPGEGVPTTLGGTGRVAAGAAGRPRKQCLPPSPRPQQPWMRALSPPINKQPGTEPPHGPQRATSSCRRASQVCGAEAGAAGFRSCPRRHRPQFLHQ